MKLARLMLPLACSAPILLGCSTPAAAPGTGVAALKVQPLLRVRDAASSARDYYQLGRYYQGQKRLAQATDAYRKALEYRKDDIEIRNALATVYSQQGKLDAAIAEFEAILQIKPGLAHLHNNLGYAYYLQGDFGKSVAAFEAALALEPRDPRAYNNLGLAYRKMGEGEKSRLAFARAAELSGPAGETVASAVAASPAGGNAESAAKPIALSPAPAAVSLNAGGVAPALAAEPYLLAHRSINVIPAGTQGVAAEEGAAPAGASPSAAADGGAGGKPFRLEISNGNGVGGLARKVGAALARLGLPTPRLTNQKPYRQPASFIEYRSGFHDEALRLGRTMSNPPALVGAAHLRAGVDVRLVLGRDARDPVALFGADAAPDTARTASGDAGEKPAG